MSEPIRFDSDGNIILKVNWKRMFKLLIIILLAVTAYNLPIDGLTDASRISFMIFVGAAGLWVTEAIPPFATGIMVIVLNVYLLGRPDSPIEAAGDASTYQIFINPIASPVLILFFGGFILASAATKHGLDVRLAKAFIKPFGTHPSMVLLGVISTTALFSMFMSNTATTAMMIAILHPLFDHFEGRTPFRRALVLSVPFAANIGGIGTIIGTPPNAVAASLLTKLGYGISFVKWMIYAVPLVIVLELMLWILLLIIFNPRKEKFEILFPESLEVTWDLVIVVITFAATVLLWLTEPLHNIPSPVTALLPIMIFTVFGIIDRNDIKKLDWDVIILVAGGLALGVSMTSTRLTDVFVAQITQLQLSPYLILGVFVIISITLSNFMSNTAASNLIIPIIITIGIVSPVIGAIGVAFACSLAMSLPVSTPPNAIAFATREITTNELAKYGTLISIIGIVFVMILLKILEAFL
ncbi:DASS family sodium-coupled anion symporter [candidate division KSB1 bacterium]